MTRVATLAVFAVVVLGGGVSILAATAGQAHGGQSAVVVPPQQDYTLNCRGCHGADGHGAPGHVPTLVGLDRFLATSEGRAYIVRVPGVSHVGISDARVAALLNWTLESFGDCSFRPYTTEEVARLRNPGRQRAATSVGRLIRPVTADAGTSACEDR